MYSLIKKTSEFLLLVIVTIYMAAMFNIGFGTFSTAVFFFAIMIHEWGHYILMSLLDTRPRFVYGWYGIGVTGFQEHLTMIRSILTNVWGIGFGLVPLVFFNLPASIMIIYLLMCGGDFLQIIGKGIVLVKYGNRKMVDLPFLVG